MSKPRNNDENGTVWTVETIFDITEQMAETNGASLAAVASESDYAKSTVHWHLETLNELGYVERRDGGTTSDFSFSNSGDRTQQLSGILPHPREGQGGRRRDWRTRAVFC